MTNIVLFVVSRLNTDIEMVQGVLSTGFSNLIRSFVMIFSVVFLLFSISARLTGILLLGVLGIMIIGTIIAICMYGIG